MKNLLKIDIIKGKDISKRLLDLINKKRIKDYGKEANLFEKKQNNCNSWI